MKRVLLRLMLAAMVLALAGVLVACGGGGTDASSNGTDASAGESSEAEGAGAEADASEDFVWFTAVVPDGFEVRGINGNYTEIEFYQDIGGGNEATIKISFGYGTVDEKVEDRISIDGFSLGPVISGGLYSWSTIDFDFNSLPSRQYIAQMTDRYVVFINGFCIAPDNADILAVVNSFKPHDDVEEMFSVAMDTSFPR